MMVRWSGERQVRVKSQKYSELYIGGRETSKLYIPEEGVGLPHPGLRHSHIGHTLKMLTSISLYSVFVDIPDP